MKIKLKKLLLMLTRLIPHRKELLTITGIVFTLLILTPQYALSQDKVKLPMKVNNLYCWDSTDVMNIAGEIIKSDRIIIELSNNYDSIYRAYNTEKLNSVLLYTKLEDETKSKNEYKKMYKEEVGKKPLVILGSFSTGFVIGFATGLFKK